MFFFFINNNAPASENGICSAMNNLYTKYQLNNGNRDFMEGTPQEIYQAAVRERNHQIELTKEGYDGLHNAFVESDVHYDIDVVSQDKVTSSKNLADMISSKPHCLVTFKVKTAPELLFFHQVAIGKNKNGGCYSFDANIDGGEQIHSCDEQGFTVIANEIAYNIHPNENEVLCAHDFAEKKKFGMR